MIVGRTYWKPNGMDHNGWKKKTIKEYYESVCFLCEINSYKVQKKIISKWLRSNSILVHKNMQ